MSVRIGLCVSRDKSKQVTWPLSSNENSTQYLNTNVAKKSIRQKITCMRGTSSFYTDENPKLENLDSSKKFTILVQRGTKRIKHLLDSNSSRPQISKIQPFEKHVCSTCKKEIGSEISRVLIMRDRDDGPCVLLFHFFFPCWDMNLLCQKYPNLIIDRLGFSFPENMEIKESSKKELQENPEFWR